MHLVSVVRLAHSAGGTTRTSGTAPAPEASLNMVREYLNATVGHIREGAIDPGISDLRIKFTSSVVADEDVAQGILGVSENGGSGEGNEVFEGCDVIAMTTNGYSGIQRWVGSVTERILHTTRLPLLIVRPAELASSSF
jgi:nucleotide-binding universal stress UspA family protein